MRHRVDAPHGAIRDALRGMGLLVLDVSHVRSFGADLVVMVRATGHARFLELKDGTLALSRQRLTDSERRLAAEAGRWFVVVRSVDEAVALGQEMLRPCR